MRLYIYTVILARKEAWRGEMRREGRGVRLVGLHVTLQNPQLERQLLLEW